MSAAAADDADVPPTPPEVPRFISDPIVRIGRDFSPATPHELRTPWIVQMASFGSREPALALLKDAKEHGYRGALLQTPGPESRKSVLVVALEGGENEAEAIQTAERAKSLVVIRKKGDEPVPQRLAKFCDSPLKRGDVHVCRNWSIWAKTFPEQDIPATDVDRRLAIDTAAQLRQAGTPARVILHRGDEMTHARYFVLAGLYEAKAAATDDHERILQIVGGASANEFRLERDCPNRAQFGGYEVCSP